MPPAARISDFHVCPMVTGIVPHVGGPVCLGMFTVMIGGMPAARVGDMLVCVGPPDAIAMGSTGVFIGGMPAARMGDMTVHGGSVALGFPTVMIGEVGGGGGGGGGTAAVKPQTATDQYKIKGDAAVSAKNDYFGQEKDSVKLSIKAERNLFNEDFKKFGSNDNNLKIGHAEAKLAHGYSYDFEKQSHTFDVVDLNGKATAAEVNLKGNASKGLVEGEAKGEALSASATLQPLSATIGKDKVEVKSKVGAELSLLKGKAGVKVNITPKTVYDNFVGPAAGLINPAWSEAPAWTDHGVVLGAEGEAGIGAAAEAEAKAYAGKEGAGVKVGAKVGAGPMAGIKVLIGVK